MLCLDVLFMHYISVFYVCYIYTLYLYIIVICFINIYYIFILHLYIMFTYIYIYIHLMSHCPMELQCLVHGFEEQNLKTAWQLDAASAEKIVI